MGWPIEDIGVPSAPRLHNRLHDRCGAPLLLPPKLRDLHHLVFRAVVLGLDAAAGDGVAEFDVGEAGVGLALFDDGFFRDAEGHFLPVLVLVDEGAGLEFIHGGVEGELARRGVGGGGLGERGGAGEEREEEAHGNDE